MLGVDDLTFDKSANIQENEALEADAVCEK